MILVNDFDEMSADEVKADFEHGFVVAPGLAGTVEAADVADYLLAEYGPMRSSQLHKNLLQGQAIALTLTGRPLYGDPIEAWEDGSVVPAVRSNEHLEQDLVRRVDGGDAALLTSQERVIVDLAMVLAGDDIRGRFTVPGHAGSADESGAVVRLDDLAAEFTRCLHALAQEDFEKRAVESA